MEAPLFFTFPPYTIPYQYVLVNSRHFSKGYAYVKKHYRFIRKVIIDSGVEIFRNKGVFDYPEGHIQRMIRNYDKVRQFVKETYLVCPDYPDDYYPRSLWISDKSPILRER